MVDDLFFNIISPVLKKKKKKLMIFKLWVSKLVFLEIFNRKMKEG